MKPFTIKPAHSAEEAVALFQEKQPSPTAFIAGGTTLVDMLKLDIAQPDFLIDLLPANPKLNSIQWNKKGLTIGSLVTMTELAENEKVQKTFPVLLDALRLAASPQIRNVATVGGNLLQQTRCCYFRDSFSKCNRRQPGSGCSAIGGDTRSLAILGTSDHCIANYPGDMAVALLVLAAEVKTLKPDGKTRKLKLSNVHRLPETQPHLTNNLEPGELITSIFVPRGTWNRSVYLKVRDRESYAFALASAAVALELDSQGKVKNLSAALGGLASIPWSCPEIQEPLKGKKIDQKLARTAAELCFANAKVDEARHFKRELGIRTLTQALLKAATQS